MFLASIGFYKVPFTDVHEEAPELPGRFSPRRHNLRLRSCTDALFSCTPGFRVKEVQPVGSLGSSALPRLLATTDPCATLSSFDFPELLVNAYRIRRFRAGQ